VFQATTSRFSSTTGEGVLFPSCLRLPDCSCRTFSIRIESLRRNDGQTPDSQSAGISELSVYYFDSVTKSEQNFRCLPWGDSPLIFLTLSGSDGDAPP
jgi:hypothetical protein